MVERVTSRVPAVADVEIGLQATSPSRGRTDAVTESAKAKDKTL